MLMPAFKRFPKEADLIGRLLAGFTEIELDLLHCVQMARDDLDGTLKSMFRTRSVRDRINIAEGLGWPSYHTLNLSKEFEMAISAVKFCSRIRNEYAHCQWYDNNSDNLAYINLERLAETNAQIPDFSKLDVHLVDCQLLTQQEAYFLRTSQWLIWLNYEGRKRAGTILNHSHTKPKETRKPPLKAIR